MSTFVNISEASTIAMHSLALIANSKQDLNANKIAEITKFSKNHLAKVLNILVRHRYLDSVRGPKGGFKLKHDPSEITLLEIFELIEGELKAFECSITCNECYFDTCLFGNFPHKFSGDFKKWLNKKTLDDFKLNKNV